MTSPMQKYPPYYRDFVERIYFISIHISGKGLAPNRRPEPMMIQLIDTIWRPDATMT